jgi:hypothetical protein
MVTNNTINNDVTATSVTWTSYTTTITATTTNPTYSGTIRSWYILISKTLFINFFYSQTTAGTVGSGTYLFNLPPGFTINTTIAPLYVSTTNFSSIGTITAARNSAAASFYGTCVAFNTTNYALLASGFNSARTLFLPFQLLGSANCSLALTNTSFTGHLTIPVN